MDGVQNRAGCLTEDEPPTGADEEGQADQRCAENRSTPADLDGAGDSGQERAQPQNSNHRAAASAKVGLTVRIYDAGIRGDTRRVAQDFRRSAGLKSPTVQGCVDPGMTRAAGSCLRLCPWNVCPRGDLNPHAR